MARVSFWSRVADWFRTTVGPWDDHSPQAVSGGAAAASAARTGNGPDELGGSLHVATRSGASGIGPTIAPAPAGSRAMADDAAENARQLSELMGELHGQLSSYRERFETLIIALQRLAEGLERLPEVAQTEVSLLGRIGEDAANGAAGIRRLGDSLTQLPQLADGVREAAVAVRREMERSREIGDKTATSVEGVRQTLAQVVEAAERWSKEVRQMRTEMNSGEQRIALLVERQTERLTWFAGAAVALGVVSLLIGLMAAFRG